MSGCCKENPVINEPDKLIINLLETNRPCSSKPDFVIALLRIHIISNIRIQWIHD